MKRKRMIKLMMAKGIARDLAAQFGKEFRFYNADGKQATNAEIVEMVQAVAKDKIPET